MQTDLLNLLQKAYHHYAWAFKVVAMVALTFLTYMVARRVVKRLIREFRTTEKIWDDTFVYAFSLPLSVMIWLVGLTASLSFIIDDFHLLSTDYLHPFRAAGVTMCFLWFGWRFVNRIEREMLEGHHHRRKKSDPMTVTVTSKLVRFSIITIFLLVVLEAFGIPLTAIWAFGSGGAIAIGIAAKDIMANFFGAIMIFTDRPFRVGDWISSPDREIEGTVSHIGWRTTKVITFEKRPLYIPNSVFSNISIVNPQRMSHRRIRFNFGVRYDDASQLKEIVRDVEVMLKQHYAIAQDQTLMVHFVEFASSSLNVEVYCFTKTTVWKDWRATREDVYFKIIEIVEGHNAQMAFPTTTLHIPEGVGLKEYQG